MRKAFNFYKSHWDQIKLLNEKQQILIFNAICSVQFLEKDINYFEFKDKIVQVTWIGIKHSLMTSIKGFIDKQKDLGVDIILPPCQPPTEPPCQPPTEPPCQQLKEKEQEKEKEQYMGFDFDLFWNSYHTISGKNKTDLKAAKKHWDKLTNTEKQKAIDNIKAYCDSISDKTYIKKARTYLADKNFNDEFEIQNKTNKIGESGESYWDKLRNGTL